MLNLHNAIDQFSANFETFEDGLRLLPDPEPRSVWCPVISVDDHALEPATLFDRVPAWLRDAAPRLVHADGFPMWEIDGRRYPMSGGDGVAGRPMEQTRARAMKWENFRPGVWDPDARVRDMDLNGVWASLNFPSTVWGFAGTRLSKLPNAEAALAAVRAYNDWMFEDWCGSHPDRFISCQLAFLGDPDVAAAEIRRNADRGVVSVSFSENPYGLGYPSIHSGHWDPFLAACAETGTVINLHVGSSGSVHHPSPDSPSSVVSTLFPINGIEAVTDWIFSKIPIRFPEIKIVFSEAGMSWVPTVIERLEVAHRRRKEHSYWSPTDPHPVELLRRNFWFASVEDDAGFRQLDLVGEDRVMLEVDYPHADGSWPDSQAMFRAELRGHSVSTVRKVCFENAAALYRHPQPPTSMLRAATLLHRVSPEPPHVAANTGRVVWPEGQVAQMVPPIPDNTRYVQAGPICIGVEVRELNARVLVETYGSDPQAMTFFGDVMDVDDVGITLHVYSTDGMVERLRFDAFRDSPHYHYVYPDGSHRKMDYDVDANGDLFEWALCCLAERLPAMLRRADAHEVAELVDLAEMAAAVESVAATAHGLLSVVRADPR